MQAHMPMKKIITILFLIVAMPSLLNAQKVGLVMSGGGARGLAHIGVIKALEEKDAALEAEVIRLREQAAELTKAADEVKKNTESALNITQESALQITQLLCIALDKGKLPLVSSEAKKMWYDNAQARIKAAAGIQEGGEPDASGEVQKA